MKKYIKLLGAIVIIGFYVWVMFFGNDPLQPAIADKILRFHVLANSDTEVDQSLKLQVRDAVGIYLKPLLEEAQDLETSKEIVNNHIEEIEAVAEETLLEQGFSYSVKAQITETYFPQKSYGEYTFPKGDYEALQLIIGKGEGQNWWCVLYPNMCFRGTVFEVIEADAGRELREVLNPWEYADVFQSGRVEFRFHFLEALEEWIQENL